MEYQGGHHEFQNLITEMRDLGLFVSVLETHTRLLIPTSQKSHPQQKKNKTICH